MTVEDSEAADLGKQISTSQFLHIGIAWDTCAMTCDLINYIAYRLVWAI